MLATLIGLSEGLDNVAQVRKELTDPLLYIAGLLLTAGLLPKHITDLLHGCDQLWIRIGTQVWIITASALVLALQWSGTLKG